MSEERSKMVELKWKHINRSKDDKTRESLEKMARDMISWFDQCIQPVGEIKTDLVRIANERGQIQ